ncbi:hypothetical protein T492DRAFT_1036119 [Pavlovales sp. CCMP2436]|nr:hypothetical protein T492DRAFT_1036119 [Pavlovales sp. CCMP2436]
MGKVRKWKEVATERASAITKDAPGRGKAWAKKLEERSSRQQMLFQQRALNDEVAAERRAERARIAAKQKRREENRLKTGTMQNVSDPRKIKRMSKKQLRNSNIIMADTTGVAPVDKGPGIEVVAKAKRAPRESKKK